MNIEERLVQTERSFNELKVSRDDHLKQAEEIFTEMTKLQGEYRVLQDLISEKTVKPNKKASTIDAVPEGVK